MERKTKKNNMNEENNQTSIEDVTNTNPLETENINNIEANNDIDYKTKFSESSKEALRLRDEKIRLENELKELREKTELSNGGNYANNSESIIPGFDHLSDEEKNNLIAYTEGIKKAVQNEVYKDPAVAFAKKQYNETVWNEAFTQVLTDFPELAESKDEFKAKYFKPDNVPSNIKDILGEVAKSHLFDKAREIGLKQGIEQANRIDTERSSAGDKSLKTERTVEDWAKLQIENPVKFAQEYRKMQDSK